MLSLVSDGDEVGEWREEGVLGVGCWEWAELRWGWEAWSRRGSEESGVKLGRLLFSVREEAEVRVDVREARDSEF